MEDKERLYIEISRLRQIKSLLLQQVKDLEKRFQRSREDIIKEAEIKAQEIIIKSQLRINNLCRREKNLNQVLKRHELAKIRLEEERRYIRLLKEAFLEEKRQFDIRVQELTKEQERIIEIQKGFTTETERVLQLNIEVDTKREELQKEFEELKRLKIQTEQQKSELYEQGIHTTEKIQSLKETEQNLDNKRQDLEKEREAIEEIESNLCKREEAEQERKKQFDADYADYLNKKKELRMFEETLYLNIAKKERINDTTRDL